VRAGRGNEGDSQTLEKLRYRELTDSKGKKSEIVEARNGTFAVAIVNYSRRKLHWRSSS